MNEVVYDNFHGLEFSKGNLRAIFFTADNNADFSINGEEGVKNLEKLRLCLGLDSINYVKQIHSDIALEATDKLLEGDAIFSNKVNTGLGVFTADCVPILVGDSSKKIIAAIHSGWRGTYNEILTKTIKNMKNNYRMELEDLQVFIGPHIRKCCYEVDSDLYNSFKERFLLKSEKGLDNHLNLEECIINQCRALGIKKENIYSVNMCTACSEEYKFYSYRKNKESRRLFSLIYILP